MIYADVDKAKLAIVIESINKLNKKVKDREIRNILRANLKPVEATMKALAPRRKTTYKKPIYDKKGKKVGYKTVNIPSIIRRYKSQKGGKPGRTKGIKNGRGRVLDTYLRGNLIKSIGIRTPRKKYKTSDVEMWVGRRLSKGSDGWYAFFSNKGTKHQKGTNWVKRVRKAHEKVSGGKISKQLSEYIERQIKILGL